VTSPLCDHWRGLLAADVLGEPVGEFRAALDDHLAHCEACRYERDELARMSDVLPLADPAHFEEHQMPPELEEAVLTRLAADARSARRRRRSRVGLGALGAVAAVLAAVVLSVTLTATPAPGRTVALRGPGGVVASVRLTSEPWGTAVHLSEQGQPAGRVLWVSMRTTDGTWWPTGTYTTVAGRAVDVDMACALASNRIASVWVRDAQGHTVLQGYVD
jgi:predicted anti-sigma-YlaC factor YlaD